MITQILFIVCLEIIGHECGPTWIGSQIVNRHFINFIMCVGTEIATNVDGGCLARSSP